MATRTQHTVAAVFRSRSDAQAAADDLQANGFSRNDIFISSEDSGRTPTGSTGQSTYTETSRQEGGISGWFKRVFGDEDETDRPHYETALSSGNILLSVDTTDENIDRVVSILNKHSPSNIQEQGGTATSTGTARTAAAGTRNATDESQAIPVVEEKLQVGKRAVLRGGVRVYSRVVEQPVEETVNLREEKVRVERQPVDRPVNAGDIRTGKDQVIEVQEYAEEPVVAKQARVVEEIRVSKEADQRKETIRDTVRHTEVNVENLKERNVGQTAGTTDIDEDFRRNFNTNYASSGATYDTYAPAYRYGYEAANDPRYRGKDFGAIESDLRTDYGRHYPNSTWEKMKDSIRYGWDKVTGKTSSAANRP